MSAEPQQNNDHAVKIWQVNQDRLSLMHQKIADTPRILSRSAGKNTCSIFRVPQSFVEINGKHYNPYIVSIGPYHHKEPNLKMIEEHKWRFLGTMLKRTHQINLEDLLESVQALESKARECYSSEVAYTVDEFVEMMVVDGCFVIELFRKFGGVVAFEPDDPLLSLSWVYSFFLRDLIRLENQLPFFVLQRLFDMTTVGNDGRQQPSLSYLTLKFFNNAFQRLDEFLDKNHALEGKHILDLLRSSFIPEGYEEPKERIYSNTPVIHCISKLRRAGIKLEPGDKGQSFLEIKFRHGIIEMPQITIDDFMSTFLMNCVAYEQCHRGCSMHMTAYATFLDCLINTARDIEYLCDEDIIENYFGTDGEVVRFINNLGKDISLDIDMCYLAELFNRVSNYYKNHWHVHWASFKYTYFRTPWSFVSALAALVLLLLTVAQTFFTVLPYFRPPKG